MFPGVKRSRSADEGLPEFGLHVRNEVDPSAVRMASQHPEPAEEFQFLAYAACRLAKVGTHRVLGFLEVEGLARVFGDPSGQSHPQGATEELLRSLASARRPLLHESSF